jgi:tetratricopeptide (TPR) repeat protein
MTNLILGLIFVAVVAVNAFGQNPSATQQAQAETAFEIGNSHMEKRKFAEALASYKQALAILPNEPTMLFNAGLAAYWTKDYSLALELWTRLKNLDPSDWHVRAKLVQTYQVLGRLPEREAQRKELFEMWQSGKPAEFKEQVQYCRDQFEVKGQKVMAFELFELKGERALRYVFSILNATEDGEEFRISLGSYSFTNAVWRETRKPKPREDERLFHLDGYFNNGGLHATYGMFFPEPSYDDVRAKVIQILEGRAKPVSGSTVAPAETKPKP